MLFDYYLWISILILKRNHQINIFLHLFNMFHFNFFFSPIYYSLWLWMLLFLMLIFVSPGLIWWPSHYHHTSDEYIHISSNKKWMNGWLGHWYGLKSKTNGIGMELEWNGLLPRLVWSLMVWYVHADKPSFWYGTIA